MRMFEEEEDGENEISEEERQRIKQMAVEWARKMGTIREDYRLGSGVAWRPHLYCVGKKLAIHIMLYSGVGTATVEACKTAQSRIAGLRSVWVGPERFLRSPVVLDSAARAGSGLVFLREGRYTKIRRYDSVVQAVYGEGLLLEAELYRSLARAAFNVVLTARKKEKGRRLEELIAFVISQVPGFKVVGTNYNTATEEIDVVVENRRISGMFSRYSGPLVLAESKNWAGKAGKNEYVSFASKIRNRRQAVSVGLFVSMGGYTQDFRLESLRDSRERFVVARFGRKELERWIDQCGEESARLVEEQVQAAVLV